MVFKMDCLKHSNNFKYIIKNKKNMGKTVEIVVVKYIQAVRIIHVNIIYNIEQQKIRRKCLINMDPQTYCFLF